MLLAVVWFPGRGYAGDMASFLGWAETISRTGPGGFYLADPSANYPPVSILVLWALELVSHPLAGLTGGDATRALLVLLKVPAVLADVGTAAIAYGLARRWRGERVGLVAAALYLVVPPVWYVSALWGQIDALLTFFSLAALALLVGGRTYLAGLAAVAAVMVKPQGILVVVLVGVVLLATLLRRDDAGRRHVGRLVGTVVVAAAGGLALLVPFDYEHLAGPSTASVPVVGDVTGFWAQSVSTGRLFPVLTADAYNPWALVGQPSLASTVGRGTAVWNVDTLPFLGTTAGVVGLIALGTALSVVVIGLVRRHDLPAVLLGYTVASYAFFVLPTRVHERYLLPAFATGVVLAAPAVWRVVAYLVAALLHTVNLHAILAPGLGLVVKNLDGSTSPVGAAPAGGGRTSGGRSGGSFGGGPPGGGPGGGGPGGPPGPGPGAGFGSGRRGSADSPQSLVLPWRDLTRTEWVVHAVSVGQALVLVGLLVAWVVVVVVRGRTPRAPTTSGGGGAAAGGPHDQLGRELGEAR